MIINDNEKWNDVIINSNDNDILIIMILIMKMNNY